MATSTVIFLLNLSNLMGSTPENQEDNSLTLVDDSLRLSTIFMLKSNSMTNFLLSIPFLSWESFKIRDVK